MRIFITGITGYIGASLAHSLLLQGHQILGLARIPLHDEYIQDIYEQITLFPYDGTYESMYVAIKQSSPDLVYHLATYYTGEHNGKILSAMLNSNIILGTYLLEAMTQVQCRNFIYASSISECYEGKAYCPLNLYAATKHAFFDLMQYYVEAGFLHTGVLVLADTYGPDDHRPKILNIIKQYIGTDQPIELSDGRQEYAAVYIDDVIRAFEMAGQQLCEGVWKHKIFQVLPEKIYTLRETVDKLLQIHQTTLNAQWGKRPSPVRDMRKVVRLYPCVPDWVPQIPLEIGLQKFILGGNKV